MLELALRYAGVTFRVVGGQEEPEQAPGQAAEAGGVEHRLRRGHKYRQEASLRYLLENSTHYVLVLAVQKSVPGTESSCRTSSPVLLGNSHESRLPECPRT